MMTTLTHALPRADTRQTSLRAAFAVLVLAMLPAVLDQTVLATALPTIAGQLGSLGDISHLVTVYVLASTASTPLWGKLGDRHGRRALLGGALTLFLLASASFDCVPIWPVRTSSSTCHDDAEPPASAIARSNACETVCAVLERRRPIGGNTGGRCMARS